MPLFDLNTIARNLPDAWSSKILGQVNSARIKILRMNEMAYANEVHDYNEGLLVLSGRMILEVSGKTIVLESGQMYMVEAGVSHAVLPGSCGSLVIIDT